jgi:GTPase SAR1 family protein
MKVVLVGDSGSGKTNYCRQLMGLPLANKHFKTIGAEVHSVNINGKEYSIWDTAGDPNHAGLDDGYYLGADAFIIMLPSGIDTDAIVTTSTKYAIKIRRASRDVPMIPFVYGSGSIYEPFHKIEKYYIKKKQIKKEQTNEGSAKVLKYIQDRDPKYAALINKDPHAYIKYITCSPIYADYIMGDTGNIKYTDVLYDLLDKSEDNEISKFVKYISDGKKDYKQFIIDTAGQEYADMILE